MFAKNLMLSPIEPTTAVDQVIHRLAQAISSGILKPGDQLPVEAELAAQLNVAQMTLRQGLNILRELGCIETTRGRNGGSFITTRPIDLGGVFQGNTPTIAEVQDMTDFRMAIENESAAVAALRADRVTIEALRVKLNDCIAGCDGGVDHWLSDNAFHVSISAATGSAKLTKAAAQIQLELHGLYNRLARPFEPILPHKAEHTEILLAIESGDPDRAWAASNAHLLTTHDFLISIVKKLGK